MALFPATNLKQAQTFMSAKKWAVPAILEASPYFALRGEGSEAALDAVENLAEDLDQLKRKDVSTPTFDAVARAIVHQNLAALEPEVLASPDFWRYLSAVRFRKIVELRHPKNKKSSSDGGVDGNWNNYGALRSDVRESLFFRLFTGAELTYDSSNAGDPYHLTRVHDVDLWQSHIVRVFTGDNPRYARALVEWFRDRSEWYSHVQKYDVKKLFGEYNKDPEIRHLRDFVKRIRRLRSNIVHEYLSYDELRKLVSLEALDSLGSIAQWGAKK